MATKLEAALLPVEPTTDVWLTDDDMYKREFPTWNARWILQNFKSANNTYREPKYSSGEQLTLRD
jgi:hypothetical protein